MRRFTGTRGLHMVMEFYRDMHDAMLKHMDWFLQTCALQKSSSHVCRRWQTVAYCYTTLKTSNMSGDGTDVRFRFRTRLQHASFDDSASEITPMLNALRVECSDATQYSRRLYLRCSSCCPRQFIMNQAISFVQHQQSPTWHASWKSVARAKK